MRPDVWPFVMMARLIDTAFKSLGELVMANTEGLGGSAEAEIRAGVLPPNELVEILTAALGGGTPGTDC